MSDSQQAFDPTLMSRISRLLGEIGSLPAREAAGLSAPADTEIRELPDPEPAAREIDLAIEDVGSLAEFRPASEVAEPPPGRGEPADLRYRVGILSAREVFSLINWHRDPERGRRLRDALHPESAEPPGEEGSVGEVLAGFHWTDDEDE